MKCNQNAVLHCWFYFAILCAYVCSYVRLQSYFDVILIFCAYRKLQDLYQREPAKYPEPEIKGLLEFEWNLFLEEKRKVTSIGNVV